MRSAETRHGFLERYADRPVLVIGTHFDEDHVGGFATVVGAGLTSAETWFVEPSSDQVGEVGRGLG